MCQCRGEARVVLRLGIAQENSPERMADGKAGRFCKEALHVERLVLQGGRYRGACLRENRGSLDESFTSSPSDFMYGKGLEVLKDVRPVRVVRFGDVCLKYYMSRGVKDILKRWCGMSKGKRSFQWALALVSRSIPTPEPVCYLDGQGGDSFYVTRFVPHAHNLVVYLEKESATQRQKCLNALVLFLNRVFCHGVYHLDLKGSNILVKGIGEQLEFFLTDTDAMVITRKGARRPLYKSLLRITRTLVAYFDRKELVEFSAGCLSNSPVTISPQDVVDQALKIQTMKQS